MPRIDKAKKLKKAKRKLVPQATKPTKKLTLPKKNPSAYYGCLYEQAQAGFPNKITACCQKCKHQGTALAALRNQEIKTLVTAYQQVGQSLKKLLQPIK